MSLKHISDMLMSAVFDRHKKDLEKHVESFLSEKC